MQDIDFLLSFIQSNQHNLLFSSSDILQKVSCGFYFPVPHLFQTPPWLLIFRKLSNPSPTYFHPPIIQHSKSSNWFLHPCLFQSTSDIYCLVSGKSGMFLALENPVFRGPLYSFYQHSSRSLPRNLLLQVLECKKKKNPSDSHKGLMGLLRNFLGPSEPPLTTLSCPIHLLGALYNIRLPNART